MALKVRRLQSLFTLLKYYSTESSELPRITVPHRIKEYTRQKKIKEELELQKKKVNIKAPRIISCKKSKFNHYKGQTYSGFKPDVLASHTWKGRKSAGDYFTINVHSKNPAFQSDTDIKQFKDFDLNEKLISVLEKIDITCPTVIQSLSIPSILAGESVQIAAETGSGKTLAYLLPIIETIIKQRQYEKEDGESSPKNSPRCIVVLPTKELVAQVKGVVDIFKREANFTAEVLWGGEGKAKMLAYAKRSNMDVLISTPSIVIKYLKQGEINLSYLQYLVLDEADTLLDDSFSLQITSLINKLGMSQQVTDSIETCAGMQLILVSATMPRSVKDILGGTFSIDSIKKITTKTLHYLMPHVPQKFMKLKPSQKPEQIILLAKKLEKEGISTMIFCNKHDTSVWLSKLLEENKISCSWMNAHMHPIERKKIFEEFRNGESNILVCTDVASRGLDTINVEHVINFDFPNFMSDYIHRAGRVGRVGSLKNGRVTSFVTYKWDIDLLWRIETAARKAVELKNINANIKRKLVGRAEIKELEEETSVSL